MAVSLRVTGAWAELTADGAVAIPATPQAGDRMYLFARWKDFSITATVADWTELAEFADGSTSAGNGTGSVKVACWYRDWQSGDTDPTVDFSAAIENASVVIMVMQKAADDVWGTPVARTAAMTNWTTTSQIVSASASVAVPSGGVVMGLIGIRDDSATMTRPTSGIDDSTGAVTWSGDYVESPATHHSTTTGFDGASDLGYRLVSVGATATLRMTGTISAAETGAALWVIQDIVVVVTPGSASLTITGGAPTLGMAVTPSPVSLSISSFAPALKVSVVPQTASLTLTTFTPSLQTSVSPTPASLTITLFAPTLVIPVNPGTVSLVITTFAPSLAFTVTPSTLSLVLTSFAPTLWPQRIIYLDPGGDAVQVGGYFGTVTATGSGTMAFDTAQKVVGVGSWKFDSGSGNDTAESKVANVLGAARRTSRYFRYDSLLDTDAVGEGFSGITSPYSNAGFSFPDELEADDGVYATATPPKNDGQGSIVSGFQSTIIPINSIIDSVKIVYERKYDTASSIGISRVAWAIGVDTESITEQGPNHDNTDMPTTDTVVEVDITNERTWERADLALLLIIAEARRGDSDTSHTQSWDYVKLEVAYHTAIDIIACRGTEDVLRLGLLPVGGGAVLRLTTAAEVGVEGAVFDGSTILVPDQDYRIALSFVQNDIDDLDLKLFVGGVEEISLFGRSTNAYEIGAWPDLVYGWVGKEDENEVWSGAPGANQVCWFDQIYIDEGDDLTDPGNILITAKLPASVNVGNFDTTVGTGAVDERPVDTANHMRQAASTQVHQNYTLQTASVGDVDISGKTYVGYLGWVIVARGNGTSVSVGLTLNSVTTVINLAALTLFQAALFKKVATDSAYPSDAAGIGMRSSNSTMDTLLHECGVVVAYEGPDNLSTLLDFQLLAENSTTGASDDMGGTPPASYELRSQTVENIDVVVTTTVSSASEAGGSPQQQAIIESTGGDDTGMVTFNPEGEVTTSTHVTEDATVELRRSANNE